MGICYRMASCLAPGFMSSLALVPSTIHAGARAPAITAAAHCCPQAILPKLALALGSMDINPAAQQLEPWGWAMSWRDVVSAQMMAGLLERAFFPRWVRLSNRRRSRPQQRIAPHCSV